MPHPRRHRTIDSVAPFRPSSRGVLRITNALDTRTILEAPPIEWREGVPYFRSYPIQTDRLRCAGHEFELSRFRDAADLLEEPDFARKFEEQDMAPYGVELWPAAHLLGEYIETQPSGDDRRALELGCGLALVAMIATLKGWRVVAADHDELALQFAAYNASRNHLTLEGYALLDWRSPPEDRGFERVFGADILYQLVDHVPILRCIRGLLVPGGVALLGDPYRGVADRFAQLAEREGYVVRTLEQSAVGVSGRAIKGRVFELRPGDS